MGFDPNIKIGVLGGGQLGRMMIQSGIDFNLNIGVLDPDPNAPCKNLVENFQVGSLTDFDTVYQFGQQFDLITIEIENVNTEALKKLQEEGKKVYPQPEIIEIIKDKGIQKEFYKNNGIPTSEYFLLENKEELKEHIPFLPAVHKLRTEGYDGRGVKVLQSKESISDGFDAPAVLEKYVDYTKELSVLVARNADGETKTYPVVELEFHPEANLVEFLFSPANIDTATEIKASQIAIEVIEKLDMIGLLAVEMFLTKDGDILVNESAPRTHNSGHHTIEANVTSQFEQHLRAILNLPLGDTSIKSNAVMINLLGAEGYTGNAKYEGAEMVMSMDEVHLHLYGKKTTKPFRKMGHATILGKKMEKVKNKAKLVKSTLIIKA
ncbi:5-(carboxyamino)imidazole ribonucleotide synthase [Reichenbachiella sp. MALMAid0571]|uniref:5-(carboxyamino)imidazole ribonucleotide synthase n=1 Tax=Reichenbachiella sp. MALMAid0571 TaxID=3143939 RepID=UPI0032DFE438